MQENKSILFQTRTSQAERFQALAKLIDAKEKTGVFMDLSKAYNQIQ